MGSKFDGCRRKKRAFLACRLLAYRHLFFSAETNKAVKKNCFEGVVLNGLGVKERGFLTLLHLLLGF